MSTALPLLVRVLRDPAVAAGLDAAGWDLLLRQAAGADMMPILGVVLDDAGLLAAVPPAPREHLAWAQVAADRHAQAVRYEVRQIGRALADTGLPLILLKGAAYAIAGLAPGRGRMFSDIDILVPKERVPEVEAALMLHGWFSAHHDAYDQRYYREWMHEIPPMEHVRRGNVIDVHHAILPETAALRPDPAKLRARGRAGRRHARAAGRAGAATTWCCTAPCTCSPTANSTMACATCSTSTACCWNSARRAGFWHGPGGARARTASWRGRCSMRCAIAGACSARAVPEAVLDAMRAGRPESGAAAADGPPVRARPGCRCTRAAPMA